jgi:hypothetical protein
VLGDDHPNTLTTASNLAMDLRALDDHLRAARLEEEIASWRANGDSPSP